jgi:hypothetical protein
MRTLLCLVALLLVSGGAAAQGPSFAETFQVRVAYGDIPTTDLAEAANGWNIEQRWSLQAGEEARTVQFDLPAGATVENVSCSCGDVTFATSGGRVSVDVPATTSAASLTVASRSPGDRDAFSFSLEPPSADPSQVLIVYVPTGADVTMPEGSQEVGSSTDGASVIHYVRGSASDPLPSPLWASVHPEGAGSGDGTGSSSQTANWVMIGIAFILGMILWAFLVARGAVQARSRRQVVETAAHVEAARIGKPMLEARKRALMAGLKELEMAKMNKEIDDASYDSVKAEFKADAVTTMRAIEEAGEEKAKG